MSESHSEADRRLIAAFKTALADARREGLEKGLAVAEKIAGWLTRQPDTPEQAEVRQWANAEIQSVRLTELGQKELGK